MPTRSRQNLLQLPAQIEESGDRSEYFKIYDIRDRYDVGNHVFLIEGSEKLRVNSEMRVDMVDAQGIRIPLNLPSSGEKFEQKFLPARRITFEITNQIATGTALMIFYGVTVDGRNVRYVRPVLISSRTQAKPLIDKGSWTIGELYDDRDLVQYSGSSYVSILDHEALVDNAPPDETYWRVVTDIDALSASIDLAISASIATLSSSTSGVLDDLDARVFTDENGQIIKTPNTSSNGLYTGDEYLGFYSGSSWKTFMQNNGNFFLTSSGATNDGYVRWFSEQALLEIKGNLVLTSGDSVEDYVGTATSSLYSTVTQDITNLSSSVSETNLSASARFDDIANDNIVDESELPQYRLFLQEATQDSGSFADNVDTLSAETSSAYLTYTGSYITFSSSINQILTNGTYPLSGINDSPIFFSSSFESYYNSRTNLINYLSQRANELSNQYADQEISTLSSSVSSSLSLQSGSFSVTTDTLDSKIFTDADGKINKPPSTSSAGLFLGNSHLGYYDGGSWKTYMDSQGDFYLTGSGGFLVWDSDASTLNISGSIVSSDGNIGGWSLFPNSLNNGNVYLTSSVLGGGLQVFDDNDILRFTAGGFQTSSVDSGNVSVTLNVVSESGDLDWSLYRYIIRSGSADGSVTKSGSVGVVGAYDTVYYRYNAQLKNVLDEFNTAFGNWILQITGSLYNNGSEISGTRDTTQVSSYQWYGGNYNVSKTYFNDGAELSDVDFIVTINLYKNSEANPSDIDNAIYESLSVSDTTARISITPDQALFYTNANNYFEWRRDSFVIKSEQIDLNTLNVDGDAVFGGEAVFSGSMTVLGQLTVSGSLASHPVISAISDIDNSNGTVIQDLGFDVFGHVTSQTSYDLDNRYYTETEADTRFANVSGDTFTGDVTFQGDVTILGSQFSASVETVLIQDNLLVINDGETGGGVSNTYAGIEVDRGSLTNFQFVFDETDDRFKVGQSGSLQSVATREDDGNMQAFGVPYYDGDNYRFNTDNGLIYSGSNLLINRTSNSTNARIYVYDNVGEILRIDRIGFGYALVVDQTGSYFGGNVGIGTNTPNRRLHVYDATSDAPLKIESGDAVTGLTMTDPNDSDALYYVGSTNSWYFDTGKVGIGNTSPSFPLHVRASSIGSNIARFDSGGAGGGTRGITVFSNDSYASLQVQDNTLSQGSWATLALNPTDGNVGIGTTTPSLKLDVNGNLGVTNPTQAGSVNSASIFMGHGRTADSTLLRYGVINLQREQEWTGTATTVDGQLVLGSVLNESLNEAIWIKSSGDVGIGTNNPSAKLTVYGGINLDSAGSTNQTLYFRNQQSSGSIASDAGLLFRAGVGGTPTDAMYIEATSLEVGIGTKTPSTSLHILKSSPILRLEHTNTKYIQMSHDGSNGYITLQGGVGDDLVLTNLVAGDIQFWNGGTQKVTITPTGKVNVLSASINIPDGQALRSGTSDAWLIGRNTGLSASIGIGSGNVGDYLVFNAGGSEKMRLTTDGNLGIGTTSPSYRLHVSGDAYINDKVTIGFDGISSINGVTAIDLNYSGANVLNTLGSVRSNGRWYLGYGVRHKYNATGYESSADNSTFVRSSFEVGNIISFKTSGSAPHDVTRGETVTLSEVFRVNLDGDIYSVGSASISYDSDVDSYFGRSAIGGTSDVATFKHLDSSYVAISQSATGRTGFDTNDRFTYNVQGSPISVFTSQGLRLSTDGTIPVKRLEVDGDQDLSGSLTFTDAITTEEFASGFAGYGARVDQDENLKWSMDLDNLTVRGRMRVYELLINQLRATNGSVWVSSTGKVNILGSGSAGFTGSVNIKEGLVAHFTFDESGSLGTNYSVFSGISGSISNVTQDDGLLGKSARFNGSNSSIELDIMNQYVQGNNDFSVTLKFNTETTSSFKAIIGVQNATGVNKFIIGLSQNGGLRIVDSSDVTHDSSNDILSPNTWYDLQFVYDSTTESGSVYLDNSLLYEFGGTISFGDDYFWAIGAEHDAVPPNLTDFFQGRIDDVRWYNRKLIADERTQIYNLQFQTNYPSSGLFAYWNFNDNSSTTVYDYTGNGHTGSISGASVIDGVIGKALLFDGTNDRVNIQIPNAELPNSNYSIESWFRIDTKKASGLVTWGDEVFGERRALFVWNGGAGTDYYLYSSTFTSNIAGTTSLNTGVWYHGVVTVDSVGSASVYLNGQLENTGVHTLNTFTGDDLYLGDTTSNEYLSGSIESAKVYNRVLTANEVEALYNNRGGIQLSTTEDSNHGFLEGDLIRAQRFTGNGIYQSDGVVSWVSNLQTWYHEPLALANPSIDLPQEGYEFVRIGNVWDQTRQGSVYMTSDDSNAPYIDIIDEIDAFSTFNTAGTIKVRLGKLLGITDATYGQLDGYGLYSQNAYLKGNLFAGGEAEVASLTNNTIALGNITGSANNSIKLTNNTNDGGLYAYDSTGNDVFNITFNDTALIAGFNFTKDSLYSGTGNYANSDTFIFLSSSGEFSLKDALTFDGTNLNITGSITASAGLIGGWVIGGDRIYDVGNLIEMDSANREFRVASTTVSANTSFYVKMYHTNGSDWGLAGYQESDAVFQLGSTNQIAGWTFNTGSLSNTNIELNSETQFIALGSSPSMSTNGIYLSGSGEYNFQYNADNYIRQQIGSFEIRTTNATISGSTVSLLTPNFFFGDSTNYVSGSGGNLDIKTGTATISGSNIVIGSTDFTLRGGSDSLYIDTGSIALGTSASTRDQSTTSQGIYLDFQGQFGFYQDANNYMRNDSSQLVIASTNAVFTGSSVQILTPNFFFGDTDNYVSGSGGNLDIKTNTATLSGSNIQIYSDNFELDAGSAGANQLHITTTDIALGVTAPTAYNSGDGIFLGNDGKVLFGDASGARIQFDGSSTFNIIGVDFQTATSGTRIFMNSSEATFNFYSGSVSNPFVELGSTIELLRVEENADNATLSNKTGISLSSSVINDVGITLKQDTDTYLTLFQNSISIKNWDQEDSGIRVFDFSNDGSRPIFGRKEIARVEAKTGSYVAPYAGVSGKVGVSDSFSSTGYTMYALFGETFATNSGSFGDKAIWGLGVAGSAKISSKLGVGVSSGAPYGIYDDNVPNDLPYTLFVNGTAGITSNLTVTGSITTNGAINTDTINDVSGTGIEINDQVTFNGNAIFSGSVTGHPEITQADSIIGLNELKYFTGIQTDANGHVVGLNTGSYARTAGDTTIGTLQYNGISKSDGLLYGGSTAPSGSTTRLNYAGNLYVNELFAVKKHFYAVNPNDPSDEAIYNTIETNTDHVQLQGKSTEKIIELPKQWDWLVDLESISGVLSGLENADVYYIKKIVDRKVYIGRKSWWKNLFKVPFNYSYIIHALRKT